MNYDGKKFQNLSTTDNGEVDGDTIFEYFQKGKRLTGKYSGGSIVYGQIVGLVDDQGNLHFRYQHLNNRDELQSGICDSKPEILPDGKIRLHETWQWTCGQQTKGRSIVEEI